LIIVSVAKLKLYTQSLVSLLRMFAHSRNVQRLVEPFHDGPRFKLLFHPTHRSLTGEIVMRAGIY
jgi:cystathionine beta-lyase/cystathionine gamma-synthase